MDWETWQHKPPIGAACFDIPEKKPDRGRFKTDMDDIVLHMWATPNSRRVSILFEELGLKFEVKPVNIRAREQFAPDILALNPFCKVPIVIWQDAGTEKVLFESGAILVQFAEAFNHFLATAGATRDETLAWLMVVLTALGPHSAQAHHWSALAPKPSEPALEYYVGLADRVYRVLDGQLADKRYLAGEYSIADIAAYPWINVSNWTTLDIKDFPNLERWYHEISTRPAVIRGMALPVGVVLE